MQDASREQARKLREASLRRVSVSGITTRVSDALQLDPAATAALSYAASAPPPAIPSVASMRPIPDAAARFHEHALEVERLRTREAERLRAREADARRDREIWEATEREQQAAAAAEAHQRARERARKAKEALAEQAARERAEAAEKEARKWEERDRKVQRFLQRKRAAEVLALASAPSGGRAAARQAPTIAAPTFRPTTAGPASSGGAAVDESLVARVVIDEGSHTTAIALEAERQYLEYPRDAQTTWAAASATSATAIAPPSLTGFVPSSTICDASATHDRLVGATPQDDSEGAPACALPVGTAILQHIMRRVGRPPGTESAANTTLDPDVFLDQLTGAGATQCLPETQLKDAPKGTLATGGQIVSALLRPKRAAPRKLRDESVILSGAGPSANNAAAASSRSNDADAHATVTFARHSLATTDVRVVALLQAEVAESAAAPAALIMSPPPPTMANAAGPLSPWILPSDSILLPADDEPRDEDALIDDASSSILLLPGDCRANGVPNQSPFYWGPWSLPSSSDHVTVAATSASVPIPGPAPPPPLWAQPFRPRQVLEADHDLVPGPQAYGAIASKQNVNLSRLAPALPVIGRSGWPDASGGPQCLPVRSENVQNASGQSAEASEPLDITFSMLLPADMPVPWRLAES